MKLTQVEANMLSFSVRSYFMALLLLYSSVSMGQRSLSRGAELSSTQERVLQTNRPQPKAVELSQKPASEVFIAGTVSADSQGTRPIAGGFLAGHSIGNELNSDLSLSLGSGNLFPVDYGIGVLSALSQTAPWLGSGVLIIPSKASIRPYVSIRSNYIVSNGAAIIVDLKNWVMNKKVSVRGTFALAYQF